MTKCELETELIMRNVNLLWYQFIQLLTQSKSTVRSQKGKTLVGQLNCVRGWWGKSRGWLGNSPPLCMVKNALHGFLIIKHVRVCRHGILATDSL